MSVHSAVTDEYTFTIRDIPFSADGTWLDISPVVGIHDVRDQAYIVSHKTNMTPVVSLQPLSGEEGEWVGRPEVLRWSAGADTVEASFQDDSTIRLRGRGAGLKLEAESAEMYVDQADGSHVVVVAGTGRRYRIVVLKGRPLDVYRAYDRTLPGQPWVAAPEGQDEWELLVQETDTGVPAQLALPSFDEVVAAQRAAFIRYLDEVAPWRSALTPGVVGAVYVDWSATVHPDGFVKRPAMLMSKQWMDKVWSWDHCFNALAIARNAEASWDQYVFMFDHQTESGGIADSVTHSEVLYNYSKPPVHGWTLTRLLPRLASRPGDDELRRVLHALEKWTNWWRRTMSTPGSQLAHYQFGNDSGWDNATLFDDEAPLQTPDLSAFLVLQMEAISSLARDLGDEETATYWAREAEALLEGLLSSFWRGDRFVALQPHTGRERWSECLLLAMPVVLGKRLPEEVLDRLAETIELHLTEFGLATERTSSPEYEADGYWRGPIWAPSTYLIVCGLRDAGHDELADKISARFRSLCERYGFAENFDALTGQGLRDRSYTWTASCYLLLAEESELAA